MLPDVYKGWQRACGSYFIMLAISFCSFQKERDLSVTHSRNVFITVTISKLSFLYFCRIKHFKQYSLYFYVSGSAEFWIEGRRKVGGNSSREESLKLLFKKKKSGISGPYLEFQHLGAVVRQIPQSRSHTRQV